MTIVHFAVTIGTTSGRLLLSKLAAKTYQLCITSRQQKQAVKPLSI